MPLSINKKQELKTWGIYFLTALLATYVHEIGHCIPAWLHGYTVIPTPAKEYSVSIIPDTFQNGISLGGILGTILFALVVMILYLRRPFNYDGAILAGAIANPGLYAFLFFIKGRGHDSTEFQEAQAAMGFSYDGHALDWIFLLIFLAGTLIWLFRTKPDYRILGRLLFGAIISIFFFSFLQSINNAIFDPIFLK